MPLDFPNSPVDGQTFTDTPTGSTYRYNATYGVWNAEVASGYTGSVGFTGSVGGIGYTGSTGSVLVTISETPPINPVNGALWWSSNVGTLLIYYTDTNSSQWVTASVVPSALGNLNDVDVTGIANNSTIVYDSAISKWKDTKTLTDFTFTNYTESSNTVSGTATTIDLSKGTVHILQTTNNATITLPSSTIGKSFIVIVKYGGVHSLTWAGGTSIKWASSLTPTSTATNNKIDIFTFFQDGAATYGAIFGQNF